MSDRNRSAPNGKITLETLKQRMEEGELKKLRIVVKADVQGSVEAVKGLIEKIRTPKSRSEVLHAGVGSVTANDVLLASQRALSSDSTQRSNRQRPVRQSDSAYIIRNYRIIYELIERIQRAVKGMLEPSNQEALPGHRRNSGGIPN